jgi:TM2 domain-containing membrane protein YozV
MLSPPSSVPAPVAIAPHGEDRRLKALGLVLLAAGGACLAWLSNHLSTEWPVSPARFALFAAICVLATNLLAVGLLVLAAGCGKTHSASAPGRRRAAVLLRIVLANVLAPAVLFTIISQDPELAAEAERQGWDAWVAGISTALLVIAWRLWRRSRQYGALGADEAMARDRRAPVLYLRSFADDGEAVIDGSVSTLARRGMKMFAPVTPEQEMAEILAHVGPVVAIGKPGEPLPELGAARLYVSDDQWQAKVIELMGKAALVVIRLGASPGLLWEIERSLERLPRRRIVFAVLGSSALAPALAARLVAVLGPTFELALPQPAPVGWLTALYRDPRRRIGGFVCFAADATAYAVPVRLWPVHWQDVPYLVMARPSAAPLRRALREVFARLELAGSDSAGRSRAVAALLAVFFGWSGAHWFYLGRRRLGVIYILTIPLLFAPLFLGFWDAFRFIWVDRAEFDSRFSALGSTSTGA